METVNWMYLLDPEGMLKFLELVCKNIHRGNVKFNADPSNLIASQQYDFFMNRIIFSSELFLFLNQPMKMKGKSKTTNQITDFCNAIIHKSVFFSLLLQQHQYNFDTDQSPVFSSQVH